MNFFKSVIPDYNNKTHEQRRDWLVEHNVIGEKAKPFGIGYRIKQSITGQASNDYPVWYLHAANNKIYYSEADTTNAAGLKPLSTIEWIPKDMRKYYLYRKK